MSERDEESYSLTLRSVRRQTIDALYEYKALTGKPICRLVDEIVAEWVKKHPIMLHMRQEEIWQLASEFGAPNTMSSNPFGAKPRKPPDIEL